MSELPSEEDFGRPAEVGEFVLAEATPGDPQHVLDTLDRYAQEHHFLLNVGPVKGRILVDVVARLGPDSRVLELGSYCGYSAVLVAMHLAPGGSLVSVDIDPDAVAAATAVVAHAGMADRVRVIQGSAREVIPTLEGPLDLVFMDHDKDLYRGDVIELEQRGLLREGSIIVADNVGPLFHADAYLDYVRTCGKYDSTHHPSTVEYTDLPDAAEISVFRG